MRTLVVAVSTAFLLMATAASAVPSVSLTWTGSSGTGGTGGSSIDGSTGDVLTLTIFVSNTTPASGISCAGLSLSWGANLTGGSAAECPHAASSPIGGNGIAGLCTPTGFVPPFLSPFSPGFTSFLPGSSISSFDAGALPPGSTGTVELGAISFTVGASNDIVSVWYVPGLDSVNDGSGGVFFPGASASVNNVPEPATAGLLALGLGALGVIGRRRS